MDMQSVRSDLTRPFARACLAILGVVSISICAIDARAATVEAQQAILKERVQTFVREITRNTGFSDDESPTRWNTPICFLAAGWGPEDRSSVLSRLAQISAAAGAPLAGKACTPNFVVIATAEPDQVIERMVCEKQASLRQCLAVANSPFSRFDEGEPGAHLAEHRHRSHRHDPLRSFRPEQQPCGSFAVRW